MDFSKQKEQILQFVAMLGEANLLGDNDGVSMRVGDNVVATRAGANLKNITEEDVEVRNLAAANGLHDVIYLEREDIKAIITNHAKNCVTVAECGVKIPAVLDDLAQIIGPSVKVAKNGTSKQVIKTLKGRNACLVKGGGVVATGRTLDEAYTGSLVLEKGAKTFIETTALGGAVLVPYFDCLLQRFVYKMKYSKKDQAAKAADAE